MAIFALRRTSVMTLFCALILLAGCGPTPVDSSQTDPRLALSRSAAAELGAELKSRLMESMAQDGPVGAVTMCTEEAPAIAQRVAEESGAKIGRTALMFRNPDNAPAPWQKKVMEDFIARIDAGADSATLEYSATTTDGGYRYMKAIGTAPVCLSCHGQVPPGPLADAITEHYPGDRATGFAAGQLRGAFVIEWRNET